MQDGFLTSGCAAAVWLLEWMFCILRLLSRMVRACSHSACDVGGQRVDGQQSCHHALQHILRWAVWGHFDHPHHARLFGAELSPRSMQREWRYCTGMASTAQLSLAVAQCTLKSLPIPSNRSFLPRSQTWL